ncbi:MAG: type II toxin-antitoxin system YafQ family toxin [Prevotella sp.]|nr:type II toxin-antitoxin system YafQ family toxin [Candidatus Equicola stercoris]
MRTIILSHQFKKDLKLARKRKFQEEELFAVVKDLANDIPLTADKKDHLLTGNFRGFRECHIRPDWLLIYKKEDNDLKVLNLYRTGTHSDLF